MLVVKSNVVRTPGGDTPYKAVLRSGDGQVKEHLVQTVREGEAYIRSQRTGAKAADDLREWNAEVTPPW